MRQCRAVNLDIVSIASLAASARAPDVSADVAALADFVRRGGIVALTGAGLSTESGIPDYRGPTSTRRNSTPIMYQTFIGDPTARHRYWARSYLGWLQIAAARPNTGHFAVATLRRCGLLSAVITQNVDGLHQAAGTADVIELHGGLSRTVCLSCRCFIDRPRLHRLLKEANPGFDARAAVVNPDGDAELADADLADFVMVNCPRCGGGPIKPDVVFFGEAVPRERVDQCYAMVESSRGLLVLGSSLTVMSGYRFVRRAAALGIPIAIVNQGPTRGDVLATVLVSAPLGATLRAVETLIERAGLSSLATVGSS